ncbi:uncharacterized protein LOC116371044 isoform X1 [Oncorhynchus kisutch]|nr:uncharacterized protein LOC116371044 isoform X1 [Oncorhynchus kisutch]
MTSLLSVDEERYVSSPEGGDREMRHRPHSAPLSSVFGISEDSVFNMVQRGQSQSEIVLSSSWSRREKYRPVKIPTDTRFMMGIVELVMNLLNSRLAELMRSFSQGTLGPLSGSISASQQFAQEMLSMVSAKMYSHAIEHIAHGHKSPLELERELEAILGPLAGQVIVIIIDSIFKAKANGRNEGRATSPLTYFLTAISAEIQSLVVQRSASRPSTRLSNNDPLLNVSKSKVLRSVLLKMAELFGQGPSETCLVPLVQSQSNNSVCDWTLNAGTVHPSQFLSHNRMTEVSSARGEETKKNRKWHFLHKIVKIPKIRIKLFKTKGEPKSHPEQDSLPTKRLRETRISQDAECEVLSTSPPKEALTTTLAPAPQESQSRKRPLIVRVLRAISRAVSKPFRKAFGKKN